MLPLAQPLGSAVGPSASLLLVANGSDTSLLSVFCEAAAVMSSTSSLRGRFFFGALKNASDEVSNTMDE